jgi:phosphatidate cytidylyltransferase
MSEFEQQPKRLFFGRTDDTVPGEGGNYRFLAALEQNRAWAANLKTRAMAGVPTLVIALLLVAFAPKFLIVLLVAGAGMYGLHEYLKMVENGMGPGLPYAPLMTGAGLMGLGVLFAESPVAGHNGLQFMLFVAVLIAVYFVWFRGSRESPRELQHAGAALLGLVLIPWFINHMALLIKLPDGRGAVNFLILVIALNDTAAYLVGSLFGKRKLIPEVSPNKTVEGAAGGLAGGMLGGLISWSWLGGGVLNLGIVELLVLGGVLAAIGQAGDLLESKLKRLNHADESGRFLPGHGGLLDRMDAYLLATPFFYYFLWFFYL